MASTSVQIEPIRSVARLVSRRASQAVEREIGAECSVSLPAWVRAVGSVQCTVCASGGCTRGTPLTPRSLVLRESRPDRRPSLFGGPGLHAVRIWLIEFSWRSDYVTHGCHPILEVGAGRGRSARAVAVEAPYAMSLWPRISIVISEITVSHMGSLQYHYHSSVHCMSFPCPDLGTGNEACVHCYALDTRHRAARIAKQHPAVGDGRVTGRHTSSPLCPVS
jgi:hypothetical protein